MAENFTKKPIILIGGIITLLTVISLVILILFWPQPNFESVSKVTIKSGSSLNALSKHLHEKNIISNEQMFCWAVQLMGKEKKIPVGTFRLVETKSNYDIIQQLVYGSPELKKVRLLEGWSVKQIAKQLNDVMGFDIQKILDISHDHKFLRKHNIKASSAEGYLFPDTYLFFDGDTPTSVLDNIVSEYTKFWRDAFRDRARELNMSEHEIVTLASIIEGEAIYNVERPIISGVYHNRLNIGMMLQADPTIQYIIDDGPRRLLNRDLKIESPYNTYKHSGLPPGPINSPGAESLKAALYPEENDFIFFVARGDGYHTFTTNEKDHNIAKKQLQKLRRELRQKKRKK
ncbi:MAG: endolytic transglycosylase MltG [Candidatus Marinimicrobia bacterium]|nr:endolytic transglycosylase MltG [Candidatus Neomarinimicrobiota bacterium]